jgi:PAS domain S-box-containing protein
MTRAGALSGSVRRIVKETVANGDALSTRFGRYALALGLVAAATVARALTDPFLGSQGPYLFHLLAVIIATWTAGTGPGCAATLAGALAVHVFVLHRHVPVSWSAGALVGPLIFTALGLVLAWQGGRWRTAERAVRASRDELLAHVARLELTSTLIEHAYDAIFVRDARRRITMWNRGASELYGWSAAEALGRDAHELLGTDAATQQAFRRALDATGTWSGQIRHRRKDGTAIVSDSRQAVVEPGVVLEVNRDVTERERAEEARRRNEEELREVSQRLAYHVSHSPLAVIEFGPDMRLTRWTGAAEQLFGWAAEEVIGKRMDEFRWVYDEDVASVAQVSDSLRIGGNTQRFSLNRNYRKDGSVVVCEWYNSSLVDPSGTLRSIMSLVLDVTERTRLERDLREQAAQLATANRLKDQFLATLSHELRTPVNAILGWSHMILADPAMAPERLRRGVETISRNAGLQAQLIEDLLDVSQIVAGHMRLHVQPVDVRPVAEQALDAVRPDADARQLRVTSAIEPELILRADRLRLQQVIANLLSNAVKFTPSGGTVHLSARHDDGAVRIAVADSGIGIAADFLPYIFDRFRQADSSSTRVHGGLGLGLAIVRHIVELHGGQVSAHSDGPGTGTTVAIVLPATPATSQS